MRIEVLLCVLTTHKYALDDHTITPIPEYSQIVKNIHAMAYPEALRTTHALSVQACRVATEAYNNVSTSEFLHSVTQDFDQETPDPSSVPSQPTPSQKRKSKKKISSESGFLENMLKKISNDPQIIKRRLDALPEFTRSNPVLPITRPLHPGHHPDSILNLGYPELNLHHQHLAALLRPIFAVSAAVLELADVIGEALGMYAADHFLTELAHAVAVPWPDYDPDTIGTHAQNSMDLDATHSYSEADMEITESSFKFHDSIQVSIVGLSDYIQSKSTSAHTATRLSPVQSPPARAKDTKIDLALDSSAVEKVYQIAKRVASTYQAIDQLPFKAWDALGFGVQPHRATAISHLWRQYMKDPSFDTHNSPTIVRFLLAIAGPINKISALDRDLLKPIVKSLAHHAILTVTPDGFLNHVFT